jgi:hypothetical protein
MVRMAMAGGQTQAISLADLLGYDIVGADGTSLGRAQTVILSGGELYAVINAAGFLGLGEQQLALPLSDMVVRENQLVVPALTQEQIDNMGAVEPGQYEMLNR